MYHRLYLIRLGYIRLGYVKFDTDYGGGFIDLAFHV